MPSGTLSIGAGRTRLRALLAAAVLALVAVVLPPATTSAAPSVDSLIGLDVSVDPAVESALTSGVPADVIVRVLPGSEPAVAALVESNGGSVDRYLPVADSLSAAIGAAALDALVARPDLVVAVTLDGPVRVLHDAVDGQYFSDDTYGRTVGADVLHAQGIDGSGVGVAMVDTGVNEVADLEGRVVHGPDLSGENDGVDRFGHGTFVAGIIAGDGTASDGTYTGVAPGAHLVSVKIAGEDGLTDVSELIAGLHWVMTFRHVYDIEVLNLAIGTDSSQPWSIDPLNHAVERVWDAGVVVVVAAGNRGPEPGSIVKPADDPYVITAGASDGMSTVERDDDIVPDFSSRGPTAADGLAKPDLVAPGAHLIGLRAPGSTVDELAPYARVDEHYFRGSGTSFSAGVVSGAVALLKQRHPDWTPDQVKGALLATTADGPVGDPYVDGAGALDVTAAASVDDPPLANQDLSWSTGLGPVTASRGTMIVPAAAEGINWQGINWQGINWQGINWQGINWQGINWQGTNWQGTNWQGINWQGTNWQGINWQ